MTNIINSIMKFIDLNLPYAPILFFLLLIIAGCNVPISEDIIILGGGILSSRNKEYTIFIYLGILLGAYIGDIISFYIGKFIGSQILKNKKIKNKLLNKVNYYYKRYGILTLFLGRLIPFGIRNVIFMSAGMGNMKPIKFFIFDFLSAIISITTYFFISYKIGESFKTIFSKIKIIIFIIFIILISIFALIYCFNKLKSKKVDK